MNKQKIAKFRWDKRWLALDWEGCLYAFDITAQYGDAGIAIPDVPVQAAYRPGEILAFVLTPDPETGFLEIMIKAQNEDGTIRTESLGLTDQIEEAERWVADANELVRRARERRERKG